MARNFLCGIVFVYVGIEFTTECEIEYIIIINVIYALTVIKIQKIENNFFIVITSALFVLFRFCTADNPCDPTAFA